MFSEPIRLFIRLSRPLYILAVTLLYFLGSGIARYLGTPTDWGLLILGLLWIVMLQLSSQYLNDYFILNPRLNNPNRSPFTGGAGALGPGKLPRAAGLWAGLTALTVAASLTVLLIQFANLTPTSLLIVILIFAGAFLYAIPPVRLAGSGYGELMVSIIIANLVPAFAFLLQAGSLHRFLAMTTFPLTLLHLSMVIAYEFPDFARDLKYDNPTMMVRMGWRNALNLHNLLILTAFLLLGLAAVLGLPAFIAYPAFLTLPLGLLQIWQMIRIGSGARPNWRALTFTAITLFGATAYLLTFAFWTR